MAVRKSSAPKRTAKSRSNTQRVSTVSDQHQDQDATQSSFGAIANTVMSSIGTGQAMKLTIDNFAKSIDELTLGDASNTIAQVQETIEHATMTAMHAKETYDLGKVAFDSVRTTAKDVFAKVKENPEPFITAAVPAAIGLYLALRKPRPAIGTPRSRRSLNGSLNA